MTPIDNIVPFDPQSHTTWELSQKDFDEVAAPFGITDSAEALIYMVGASDQAWSILWNNEPVGAFGVGSHPEDADVGVPWLVGTDALYNNPEIAIPFAYHSRRYTEMLAEDYKLLVNYADASHTKRIQWLKFCGFQMIARHEELGPFKRPFFEYIRITKR